MIKASAPCRISLFGGGTDVGEYANKYSGLCINFAISLRQTVIVGGKQKLLPDDNPEFFKTFINKTVEHIFEGEIESGLGSSASLAVALEACRRRLGGWNEMPQSIANQAFWMERDKIGLFGGEQDQYCAACGGFNKMQFNKTNVVVTSLPKEWIKKLYPYMVLLSSGIKRTDPRLQEGLRTITFTQKETLDKIKAIAEESIGVLERGNIEELGKLLSKSWELKKQSNKGVSSIEIDELYEYGMSIGALGGKVLGSGGGGCLFFLVEPKEQREFIEDMKLKHIPFEIDWKGVRVEEIRD